MSKILLAEGQITPSDGILIELVEALETPPTVLLRWPAAPSVVAPTPRAIANIAAAIVRTMAEAQARLAAIRTVER